MGVAAEEELYDEEYVAIAERPRIVSSTRRQTVPIIKDGGGRQNSSVECLLVDAQKRLQVGARYTTDFAFRRYLMKSKREET